MPSSHEGWSERGSARLGTRFAGLLMLSESHLTVHTFPECGVATFNLYCCRPRPDWPWNERLRESLGATDVRVRSRPRG